MKQSIAGLLIFFLGSILVLFSVPINHIGASSGWLSPGNFATYRAGNATNPGMGLQFGSNPQSGNSYVEMNYFTYSWKALSVATSTATMLVSIGGEEVIPPSYPHHPLPQTKVLNESVTVILDTSTLKAYDNAGNEIGVWNFWIDASEYSSQNSTSIPFTDTWEGMKLTARVGSCGPNLPPINTSEGPFYDYLCKSTPVTAVAAVGDVIVTDTYDKNIGLMLSTQAMTLDDILYSSFGVAQWSGPGLVLYDSNVDLHHVIGGVGQSLNWGLYLLPPLLIAVGLTAFWFARRHAFQRRYPSVG